MVVSFLLRGQPFLALNGGPQLRFSEAISFSVECEDQAEVDRYWSKLTEGGEEGPCAWLKDKFGVSWQIVPKVLPQLMSDPDPAKVKRVTEAMFKMKKIVIADLLRAYES